MFLFHRLKVFVCICLVKDIFFVSDSFWVLLVGCLEL